MRPCNPSGLFRARRRKSNFQLPARMPIAPHLKRPNSIRFSFGPHASILCRFRSPDRHGEPQTHPGCHPLRLGPRTSAKAVSLGRAVTHRRGRLAASFTAYLISKWLPSDITAYCTRVQHAFSSARQYFPDARRLGPGVASWQSVDIRRLTGIRTLRCIHLLCRCMQHRTRVLWRLSRSHSPQAPFSGCICFPRCSKPSAN